MLIIAHIRTLQAKYASYELRDEANDRKHETAKIHPNGGFDTLYGNIHIIRVYFQIAVIPDFDNPVENSEEDEACH